MHSQKAKQERYILRRWMVAITVICLFNLLGCSLAHSLVSKMEPRIRRRLPTLTPTVFHAPAPMPTFTPAPPRSALPAKATALPLPTNTLIPSATPIVSLPITTPLATNTSVPVLPTATPSPVFTPDPGFAFLVAEIYTNVTTNHFLTGYIAIVSEQEVPIGGIKAVGNFEPGDYYHESPLSNWFLEGYSVPGEVIKSGSVKFEPPGGIIKGTWHIHLEDEHGTRLSDDVPITTDPENKEWFFIKFRKRAPMLAPTATPIFVAGVTPVQTTTSITQTTPRSPTPPVHPYCRYHPFAVRCRK